MKKPIYKIVVICCLIFIILISFLPKGTTKNNSQDYIIITVKKGDTLWRIASLYKEKNDDIRKIIYMIRKDNNLESADIFPGQILKIPLNISN
ncbi:MAG: hypothetical protein PWP21_1273 [Thermosediminibacterales bacterium]|nr:hypothetical protein [Thermosediminibacterales bacterium]